MSVTHPLEKGDHVWDYEVEHWNDLLAEPRVKHGLVIGSGPVRITVNWGPGETVRYSRPQLQRQVYETKREALEGGKRRLEAIRHRASERMNMATEALAAIQELLDEAADLLPCGCPVDLPEGHQEGCQWTEEAMAERQLERSLDEQQ